mmetsp:Transcript_43014/g.93653  ORF Transcript_43014/g.93653 Transcript_43014/m.93653 type:complete len:82 (+) Transcript_43014:2551-2796(+)
MPVKEERLLRGRLTRLRPLALEAMLARATSVAVAAPAPEGPEGEAALLGFHRRAAALCLLSLSAGAGGSTANGSTGSILAD